MFASRPLIAMGSRQSLTRDGHVESIPRSPEFPELHGIGRCAVPMRISQCKPPADSERLDLDYRRVVSILSEQLARHRGEFVSNKVEIVFLGHWDRDWPMWTCTFRKKWPIKSDFGLVTVDITYQWPLKLSAPEPICVRWQAEVFPTGGDSRFHVRGESSLTVEELRNRGVLAVVSGLIETGTQQIQAATGSRGARSR